jgi:hypothetical protein
LTSCLTGAERPRSATNYNQSSGSARYRKKNT